MKTLLAIAAIAAFGAANSPYDLGDLVAPLPSAVATIADAGTAGHLHDPAPAEDRTTVDTPVGGVRDDVRDAVGKAASNVTAGYHAVMDHADGDRPVGPAAPGSRDDIVAGLGNIVAGARDGLADTVAGLAGTATPEVDAPAAPATATLPQTGARRGDVAAALAVITRDDAGVHHGAARWKQPRVGVTVVGDAADDRSVAQVDEALRWLTARTGVEFARGGGDDIVVDLSRGRTPRVDAKVQGGRYLSARVQWDPTHPHATRWAWEELLQASGAFGDHGPAGSVLSHDQSASTPSDFDAWTVAGLYAAADISDAAVEQALAASR